LRARDFQVSACALRPLIAVRNDLDELPPILVPILLGADPLAAGVVVTTAVVVVVVAIGTYRRGSDRSAGNCAAIGIASVTRVTRDGTTGIAGATGITITRAACDGVGRATHTAGVMAATMESSGMDGPTTVSAAAPVAATATAAPGQRVIGSEGCADNHDSCKNDETVAKHGIPPSLGTVHLGSRLKCRVIKGAARAHEPSGT
jgi:hypothetical protein